MHHDTTIASNNTSRRNRLYRRRPAPQCFNQLTNLLVQSIYFRWALALPTSSRPQKCRFA
jgi:hypothetical protein